MQHKYQSVKRYLTFENDKFLIENVRNKNTMTWHILILIVSFLVICLMIFSCYKIHNDMNVLKKTNLNTSLSQSQFQELSSIYPQKTYNYTLASNNGNTNTINRYNPFYFNVSLLVNKTIYIIRHCEKSRNKDMGLNELGLKHAVCLVPYFKNFPMGSPKILYGAISRTMRSVFTLIPISVELKLPLYGSWKSNDIRDGIFDIYEYLLQYDVILVAWEHRMIPHLASGLGCTKCNGWNKYDSSLRIIDDNLYNITWVLRYNASAPSLYIFGQNFHSGKCIDNFTYESTEYK
jgi:hypothetical protein